MRDDYFEVLWETFLDAVHKDARLKEDTKVEALIGGVSKFKKLLKSAYEESNEIYRRM